MNRKIAIGFLIAVIAVGGTVVPALAAPPLAVHIEVTEELGTSGEAFAASGAAVDAGLVCATGTVDDLSVEASGPSGGTFTVLRVLKRFNCGDASGTFDVSLVVYLDLVTHYTTATWRVVDGTGDYVGLIGNGLLAGTPIVPGVSILDVYDGFVH